MAISPALCGISLILPRIKHGAGLLQRTAKYAFGRLTNSSACLHAVVPAFVCLRVSPWSGELGAPHKSRCFGTQAWQDVAPYSSRRHSQDCLPERQVKVRGGLRKGDFEDSTCICLPARSPVLRGEGRAPFEQPRKDDFFSSLF